MKKYLILLICILSLGSCVEDDGNYVYNPSRNLTIKGIDRFSKMSVGDEPKVMTPTVIERYDKKEKAIEGAKLEWFINGELVAEGPSYTFNAEKNGRFLFNLRIEDPVTKSISNETFDISVESPYVQGFMILSELEGKSALSFIRTTWKHEEEKDTVIYVDDYLNVFEKENDGESLLKEPVMITENLKNDYTALCGEISVLTRDGDNYSLQDLSGETLTREVFIQEEFEGEELPSNWRPKQMLNTIWDSFILNEDGKVYVRRAGSGEAYHTGVFSKDVTLWNDAKFERLIFSDYVKTKVLLGIELTEDGKRQYVGIYNSSWSGDDNLNRLKVSGDYTEDFLDIKDEIIFSDWRRAEYGDNAMSIAQVTPTGECVLHCFNTGSVNSSSETVPVKYSKKINLTKELGMNKFTGLCTEKHNGFTYVSDDNTIYWVKNEKKHEEWGKMHTFDKKIVSICDQSTFSKYFDYKVALAIAFEDGTIEVWEVENEEHKTFTKKVYTAKNNFGKIKQVMYKCGQSVNYM